MGTDASVFACKCRGGVLKGVTVCTGGMSPGEDRRAIAFLNRCAALPVQPCSGTIGGRRATTRFKVQTDDPSPSAQEFRLLLNGLAPLELRRMFCSDEGAGVR